MVASGLRLGGVGSLERDLGTPSRGWHFQGVGRGILEHDLDAPLEGGFGDVVDLEPVLK